MFVNMLVVRNPVTKAKTAHDLSIGRVDSSPWPELCSRSVRRRQTVSSM